MILIHQQPSVPLLIDPSHFALQSYFPHKAGDYKTG